MIERLTRVLLITFILLSIWPAVNSLAQDTPPPGPVYIVQSGDSLWDIAQRFRVSMEELAALNNITNPAQIALGAQLVIPGLEGMQGVLTTQIVPFGETLNSLSRRYRVPQRSLAKLNHVVSRSELYAGAPLVIPESSATPPAMTREMLRAGQPLLELAVANNANPWALVVANALSSTWSVVPGEILLLPGGGESAAAEPGGLPGELGLVEISPLPMLQGKASVISIAAQEGTSVGGAFTGHELHFFPSGQAGRLVALQGVHAMTEPGLYPLTISGILPDGAEFSYSQMVSVGAVDYPYDRPLTVDQATIDPAVTKPEDAQWSALTAPATPERIWEGIFRLPSPLPQDYCVETNDCWSSRFGNRRSYNGSAYEYFHTGLDVVGGMGSEIFAPAAGVVIFAGPLTVRGNATMIDHGWGVYTGYMHQSEIMVKVGDRVEAGQLIGLVGGTGRVEGPHLHWEVWVGGVQVDPLDWLQQAYP